MFISQVLGTCKSSLNTGLKHAYTNPTTNAHTPQKSVSNKNNPRQQRGQLRVDLPSSCYPPGKSGPTSTATEK